jgi:hypothetical protein
LILTQGKIVDEDQTEFISIELLSIEELNLEANRKSILNYILKNKTDAKRLGIGTHTIR